MKNTRSAVPDSLNTPGLIEDSSSRLLSSSLKSWLLCVAQGMTNRLNTVITIITGRVNVKTGFTHDEMPTPELNQTTISLSRCQRVKVSNTAKNRVNESNIGRNFN